MSDISLDDDITGDFVRHLGVEFGEVTGDRVVADLDRDARACTSPTASCTAACTAR